MFGSLNTTTISGSGIPQSMIFCVAIHDCSWLFCCYSSCGCMNFLEAGTPHTIWGPVWFWLLVAQWGTLEVWPLCSS